MTKFGPALALIGLVGCASAPSADRAPAGSSGEASGDPEFRSAVEAAEREFETQEDALAAGVYETFVHPDSIGGVGSAEPRGVTRSDEGDPSTAELLGTLDAPEPYNRAPEEEATWTLQMGAFGSESGALVRIENLQRTFPGLPTWFARGEVYRVYLGRFGDRRGAERLRARAIEQGYADAFVTQPR